MKLKRLLRKPIQVTWRDATSYASRAWFDRDDILAAVEETDKARILQVGVLIGYNKRWLILGSGIESSGKVCQLMMIPRAWTCGLKRLK